MKKIKMEKIEKGIYEGIFEGEIVRVVHYSHYCDKRNLWNLIINDFCIDCFETKSEALAYAVSRKS